MRFFNKTHSVIGVDIGSRFVKAVQLYRSYEDSPVAAMTLIPRVTDETLIDAKEVRELKQVLQRKGFSGTKVAINAQEQTLLRGTLELPPNVTSEVLPQMARLELARIHRTLPDSFEMVSWNVPRSEDTKASGQVYAVACPHEAADAYLDAFEEGGLQVVGLDLHSHVTARVCEPLTLPAPTLTSVLDLGWSSTKLLLLCGSQVIYECFLECPALQTLIDRLSKRFGVAPESAWDVIHTIGLVAEGSVMDFDRKSIDVIRESIELHFSKVVEALKVPFNYAGHQYPGHGVRRLLLIGGGAGIPGLIPYFEPLVQVEVLLATPYALHENLKEHMTHADNPAMTVALGLASFSGV